MGYAAECSAIRIPKIRLSKDLPGSAPVSPDMVLDRK